MKNKIKPKCKHNGGKGYWSNMKGAVCLKCGKELSMVERFPLSTS